jgi:hypothetical protein
LVNRTAARSRSPPLRTASSHGKFLLVELGNTQNLLSITGIVPGLFIAEALATNLTAFL